jgi:peptidoglycan/xylan/chitin deacetylase (PgdA/CDA1 family)
LVTIASCFPNKEQNQGIDIEKHKKKEVVVFVYHRFGNNKYPSTNISISNFEQHLTYLKENNYTVLNFGDAVDYINNPETPYMKKVACITVDDGYKTFKSNAMPLLSKFDFNATLFINSESVGGGSYLDWSEIREVYIQGIEVGNHSHSHAYFLNVPKNKRISSFKKDLQKCQEEIHKHLGFYPDIFAYPYGEFDLEMKEILNDLGFKAAAAQNSGVMYKHDNYSIPRFPMAGPFVEMDGFIEKANMKALRIESENPESFVLEWGNPPKLIVEFDSTGVDLQRYNCFTNGECETFLTGNFMTVQSKKKLEARRTLYKITAPSKDGKSWHWYSHLWIQPEIKE